MIVNTATIATVASVTPKADKTTAINTTTPLTGGGDLSATRTLAVNTFAGSAVGVVPSSVGGSTNFLRADGLWASPAAAAGAYGSLIYACSAGTTSVVNHGYSGGARSPLVQISRSTTPWDVVEADIEFTTASQITVRFATAVSAGEYSILVAGKTP